MTEYVLTKFGVSNYKAISKYTEIEFNPVTLLIGDKDSGKTSLLNALCSFVECKGPERYLDIQPFYFNNVGNYLDFESVKNKFSSNNSSIEYHFTIAHKPKLKPRGDLPNVSNEKFDVSIKFGMDTERIRLKESTIKVVFENDDEIELLYFVREEKRNILRLNLLYILEVIKAKYSYFYTDIYESDAEKLIGDLVSCDIAKEIMELGYKGFTEDRRYENGIFFPKSLLGVIRNYKYYLCDIFFKKYREDVYSTQYKCANKAIESMYEFIREKLTLLTDAIDVKHIDCSKIKVEENVLPSKYYNDNIFKKRFIEYIENIKYDVEALNILKQLTKDYQLAEDIAIEGDFNNGYSIYIVADGVKQNLTNTEISLQHIIAILLMVLMNGEFKLCFKDEEMMKYHEPNYKPIIIGNPEYYLNIEHQFKLADIINILSKKLNTQIIIETLSKIMIKNFKGTVTCKFYCFCRNIAKPAESPEVIEFRSDLYKSNNNIVV